MTTARTPWGAVQGVATRTGLAFLGLRYGEPPLGVQRWKPPRAWRPADGLYDATAFAPSPPQSPSPAAPWRIAFAPREMSEDCLNLNVWTPAADGARRPVLVHVFGGGFETGSASEGLQDAEALSTQGDVVVVRVNFRIGALGFLELGSVFGADYESANRGALDLALGLSWVHDNISALGGDPDNVTLFGLSSGAFMIASLFAMPEARGLVHRAWMQSGSASRVLTRAQAGEVAAEFLRAAGVTAGDAEALERLPIAAILAAQRKAAALDLGDRNGPGGHTLGIVEDGTSLPEHPLRAFERGAARETPVVLGYTRDEARLWFASGAMRLPQSFEDVRAEVLRFAGAAHGERLFAFYRARFPDADPTALRQTFLSDAVYKIPAIRTAEAQTRAGGRAHLYRFDWSPPGEQARLGASHGFDEAFVWNNTAAFPLAAEDPLAAPLGKAMSSALLGLARDSQPGWPVFGDGATQVFGGAGDDDDLARARAWDGVEKR